jgi:hypothetical protein
MILSKSRTSSIKYNLKYQLIGRLEYYLVCSPVEYTVQHHVRGTVYYIVQLQIGFILNGA